MAIDSPNGGRRARTVPGILRVGLATALGLAVLSLVTACVDPAPPTAAETADPIPAPVLDVEPIHSPTPGVSAVPAANATPAHSPTATPTPTTVSSPAPAPIPTLTSDEFMEEALSEHIPWYDDPPYPLALLPIREVWWKDPELGRELAQAPWIADGLADWEDDAVYGLGHLADYDLALARQMLAYAAEEPVRSRNTFLLSNLGRMLRQDRESFEQLIARPWFADGLDAEERSFVTAVSNTTGVGGLYRELLAERYTLSANISPRRRARSIYGSLPMTRRRTRILWPW